MSSKFVLSNLRKVENEEQIFEFEFKDLNLRDDVELRKPFKITLTFVYREDYLEISGSYKVPLKSFCSRCLQEKEFDLDIELYEKMLNEADINNYEYLSREDLEEIYKFYENDLIDIENLVIESILLNLPIKVLCKADCKGICVKCGQDLNNRECDCVIVDVDPRLADLLKLKDMFEK